MLISRRKLLLSGAAAAGVTALGVPEAVLPPASPGFQVLSDDEAALVDSLGDAFFPPGNPLGVSASEVDVALLVDGLLADDLDASVQPVFRYLLKAFDLGTFASRGGGFASLSLEDRRAILETWADNAVLPRRLAYDGLKTVIGMAFFNSPRVTIRLGWFPRCHQGAA